jgi:hypothetical protein
MDGHDVQRPMTNARAEIGASEAPAPFREPREALPRREPQPRREAVPIIEAEPIIEADRVLGEAHPVVGEADPVVGEADPVVAVPFARATPPPNAGLAREFPRPGARFGRPGGPPGPGAGQAGPQRPAPAPMHGPPDQGDAAGVERGATAPQLRRFIKSRAYVPIHELRRRFGLNGNDDDVTPVDIDRTRVFVGLPDREGRLLGELLRAGDIGYELSMDPVSPIVVGVYPMRPVTRN